MRYVFVLLACSALVACSARGLASGDTVLPGRGARFWSEHSLIYAEVVSFGDSRIDGFRATLRPFGTLSGKFDAGKTPLLSVGQMDFDGGFPGSAKDRLPVAGDYVLIAAEAAWNGEGGYSATERYAFVPGPWHTPTRIVQGFSDSDVAASLKAVQELRKLDGAASRVKSPLAAATAFPHVLIYARLVEISDTLSPPTSDRIVFRGPRVLSGGTLLGETSDITAAVFPGRSLKDLRSYLNVPTAGKNILADIAVVSGSTFAGNFVVPGAVEFMPGDHSPICEVKDFDDPKVAEAIRALEVSKYWETHSLIYAELVGTMEFGGESPRITFDLRPKLTLSGHFDCGKTPELSASVALKDLGPNFKSSSVGANALIVLAGGGDSYSIPRGQSDFMPGDHAPICGVRNFEDPKVRETLTAVQKLRHASDDTKPKDEPVKN